MSGGHGHVVPRPDGAKARCGGPALCGVCARELAAQSATVTAQTPGQAPKSRVSLEATELNEAETGWVTAGVFIEREGGKPEDDPEAYQALDLNHGEMRALYDALSLYYTQGIWSTRTTGPAAAREPQPAPPIVLTEESLGALVNAGQDYDYRYRPQGRNWGRVSDHQAARLILGAIAALREQAAPAGPQPAPELAAAVDAERNRIRQMAIDLHAYAVTNSGKQIPFEEFLRRSPEENAAAIRAVIGKELEGK